MSGVVVEVLVQCDSLNRRWPACHPASRLSLLLPLVLMVWHKLSQVCDLHIYLTSFASRLFCSRVSEW